MYKIAHSLLKELHCDSFNELLSKTRDLKEANKRHTKEVRLILNLKMLMRDFTNEGYCMLNEINELQKKTLLSTLCSD